MYRIFCHNKIFQFLIGTSFLFVLCSCKKPADNDSANLNWIQFRLISSDPNIRAVGLTAEAIHSDGIHYTSHYHLFQSVNTKDTFVMRLRASPGQSFLNSSFQTTLRIQHINKVYSPVLAASGVYVEGDPYLIGWHHVRQWGLKQPEAIHTARDTIYYIKLQTDTSKYVESLF